MSQDIDTKAHKKLQKALSKNASSPINDYTLNNINFGELKSLSINGSSCGFRMTDADVSHLSVALYEASTNIEILNLKNHRITGMSIFFKTRF